MSKFLNKLKKVSENEYGFIANEENNVYSYDKMYSTGCYILNGLISGDIYGGIIPGRRLMIAGPSSTAKSYLTSLILKSYLNQKPKCQAIIFESEGSTVLEMSDAVEKVLSVAEASEFVGINKDRILILPVRTVEDCRTQCMKLLKEIKEHNNQIQLSNDEINKENEKLIKKINKAEKAKTLDEEKIKELKEKVKTNNSKIQEKEEFIFLIDSIGNLSTNKEVEDVVGGNDKVDMTKAKLLRGFGRVSSLEFSLLKIPLLVVNHSYAIFDQYTPDAISGGGGPMYMADTCLVLSKGKEKDDTDKKKQTGVRIGVGVHKSRFTKEGITAHIIISFKHGLYPYSDLEEFAKKTGVFKTIGQKYILPDGTEEKTTIIRKNFKQYANDINMNAINKAVNREFKFGQLEEDDSDFSDIDDDIIEEVIENETEE